ncbi:MAG: class I SAM-dependent methyltransferase [Sideroxydans sp.]|nr:class I SAM-dependent methyltransferase [Sideroxydans sp.]
MSTADHFSAVASAYAAFRPDYPPALFDWLARVVPNHQLAWDCAAGSGQATVPLASRFERILATDLSAAQLSSIPALPNICTRVAPAEDSGLSDCSTDLVTVAQALHWFDQQAFHTEVQRVLRPGGVIAVWSYSFLSVPIPAVQRLLDMFYESGIGHYWPPERVHVENGYRELPFPYTRIKAPTFDMHQQWTRDHLLGYLRSWSAVARFHADKGYDPVEAFAADIESLWPEAEVLTVSWPLFLLVGIAK